MTRSPAQASQPASQPANTRGLWLAARVPRVTRGSSGASCARVSQGQRGVHKRASVRYRHTRTWPARATGHRGCTDRRTYSLQAGIQNNGLLIITNQCSITTPWHVTHCTATHCACNLAQIEIDSTINISTLF